LKVSLDTSVLVALLAKASERHSPTRACYQVHRKAGDQFVLTEHALLEAFAVLSRSPRPISMPPSLAREALLDHFRDAIIAPFRSGLAWDAMAHTLSRGHWGGRIYDAVIALSAFEAGARVLLTWNVRHFISVSPPGLEVRAPQGG
jgi:predicted nucleic acid-binding protein